MLNIIAFTKETYDKRRWCSAFASTLKKFNNSEQMFNVLAFTKNARMIHLKLLIKNVGSCQYNYLLTCARILNVF